jgi:sortase A
MVAVVSFHLSVGSRTAYAEPEQLSDNTPAETQTLSLEGYSPDQSLWSPKMIAKYETAKHTDETPLALLKIDRLNLEAPVYYGTKRITLDRGLGLVEGTAGLDETGNIGLSGHRDSFFRVLKDIEVGDTIEMQTLEGIQNFQVSNISIVDALDVSVLDPTDTTVLTLITCHPFYYVGYAPNRYIVRATPVGESLSGSDQNSILGATQPANNGIQ